MGFDQILDLTVEVNLSRSLIYHLVTLPGTYLVYSAKMSFEEILDLTADVFS